MRKAKSSRQDTSSKLAATSSGQEQVLDFIANCEHPLKNGVEAVREIILSANKKITEHIKWKAPSFCIDGDDRVTFNIHKNEYILLVFHRGAKVKEKKGNRTLFEDKTGLLEWLSDDRAIVKFYSVQDVTAKKVLLKKVVKQWIAETRDKSPAND